MRMSQFASRGAQCGGVDGTDVHGAYVVSSSVIHARLLQPVAELAASLESDER